MLIGQMLAKPVCHFLWYLYPAYESYKCVKKNDPALHTQWLMFWIVSTYLSIFETLGDMFLTWVPMYHELKMYVAFFLLLLVP
jgi:receptor expression-enhancing protein 1/2/3/4